MINVGAALGAATVPPVVSLAVRASSAAGGLGYRALPLLVLVLGGLDVLLVFAVVRALPEKLGGEDDDDGEEEVPEGEVVEDGGGEGVIEEDGRR